MRYEQATFEPRQPVDEAAVAWLTPTTVLPLPPGELEPRRSAPAAPDVPGSVGGTIVASYVGLIGALYIATAGSRSSIFAIVIAMLFVAVFFTIPRIFFAIEPMMVRRPKFCTFIKRGMATHTGHSSGPAALVQMLIVPVFLTLAVLAMGLIISLT